MDIYSTEEQQAEAIKRFFRENGLSLALGVIVGLGGLYGWKAYNQNQITTAEQASDAYTTLVSGESVLSSADTFISENKDTNYATLAAFVAAKDAVEANDLDAASEKLSWIVSNVKNDELKAIAITRLARVQIAQQQYDEALTSLNASLPDAFSANVAELKGDIYTKQGDKKQARAAYQAAVDAGGLTSNPLLQIKLDDLAVTSPAA
ncbi:MULTISPECIES: tetratricopeptide repeat protein [Pseudoalteromonas]|uniref:Ancillary SecYEG translocon subunit n=1 Tax=Pseudoalteromonas translucida (strain TAC 125) TaxID=326442 RepID=Q3ICZ7_PSET1|nr:MULTISPECIES: tetratricopeptide repeat protein [Pseudoalteromonas]MBB1371676.1 tetratricopeptide repeat protein [Pseudoalteromonas sp. SR45-4]MBB1405291.1 tetratricopeptide repeat protein [Pseudoalteromonas sp. SG44-5]MBH0072191.1 tetratricopeptide repeat protein [Pseudoalteromonas sp. NZS127]MBH0092209.1 tetratricopeptide repeat protein [Pseudoalteromonas sp. SCQQ13]NYR13187.1 tetratricopeptide repeat protein [Pseudoalteromonas sp. MIP2626]|tara:strand:+ start:2550 stop:3170 length:621 start_codon:yes stop_codon:yes gene_type:complete